MKSFQYDIAGLNLKIISNRFNSFHLLRSFMADNYSETNDLEIIVNTSAEIARPEGKLLVNKEAKWVCLAGEYYNTSVYFQEENTGKILCRADANKDWSRAEITCLDRMPNTEAVVAGFLCEILFRNRMLFKKGIVIHASALSWEGQGLVFVAPSGTGKSTQANLWAKYMGARVLNDDRPALRAANKMTYVYGTPWSGKKTLYHNSAAPLKAIVLLEQAPENQIAVLLAPAAVAKILPRCFLPYYDQEIMAMCLSTLEEMLAGTSVYLLRCRPDKEAAELLHQCLTE